MRKIFVFAIALMMLMSLSTVALAKSQHGNIILNRIIVLDESPVTASVSIKNDNTFDFGDGKVVISIPELGVRASKNVDIGDGRRDTKRVSMELPEDAPSGEYWVRIVVSNDEEKRVRHRVITI